jgi:hypothetical protein
VVGSSRQSRRLELLHQHHRAFVSVEQQHSDRVAAFENQAPLHGTHGSVGLPMSHKEFVDLEKVLEKAPLARNHRPARHYALRRG